MSVVQLGQERALVHLLPRLTDATLVHVLPACEMEFGVSDSGVRVRSLG